MDWIVYYIWGESHNVMGWCIVQYIFSLLTVLLARTFPQLQDDGPAPVYTTLRTPVYNSQESLQNAANRVCQIEGGLKKMMQCNGGKEKEKSDLNKSEEQMGSEWWRQNPGEWSGNKLLSHGEIKVGSNKTWDVSTSEKKKINCNGYKTKWNNRLLAVPNVSPDVPKCKLSLSTMAIH